MALRFSNHERIQRGRGIGGLLRIAKSFFKPIIDTVGRAVGSSTGKRVINSVKKQALESGSHVLGDLLEGNNLSDSLSSEANLVKNKIKRVAGNTLTDFEEGNNKKRKKKSTSPNKKKAKKKKKKTVQKRYRESIF